MRHEAEVGRLCRKGHRHDGKDVSLRYATGHCVMCVSERRKKKYMEDTKHRAKLLAKRKEQRARGAEALRQSLAEYYRKNRDTIRHKAREKYRASPGAWRTRRLANIENHRKYDAQYKRAERRLFPEKARSRHQIYVEKNKLRISLRNRVSRAFKLLSDYGKQHTCSKYGIDIPAILEHLGPCPGLRKEWHIDHIRPLAAFDFDNPEQVRSAFAPENHQWLPAKENLTKNAKYAICESR